MKLIVVYILIEFYICNEDLRSVIKFKQQPYHRFLLKSVTLFTVMIDFCGVILKEQVPLKIGVTAFRTNVTMITSHVQP